MKIDQTQLDLIDYYLEQHKLDFFDFKIEIKDHLACAIESIMTEQSLSFEEAFIIATDRWNELLKVRKYWIISNERLFPEIVIRKIKNRVIFHYSFVLIISLFLAMLLSNLKIQTIPLLKYVVAFCGLTHLILSKLIKSKNIKTSYRFLFDYFHIPAVLFFIHFFFFKTTFAIANFIGFLVLINFPFIIYYFMKHQHFVKKYDLS